MEALLIWLAVIVPSGLWGALCARVSQHRIAAISSAAVPWLALLAAILYAEYVLPYEGGGASMWPIAQLVGGTAAAFSGYQSYRFYLRRRHRSE